MTTRPLAVLVLLAGACAHSGGSGDATAARPAPAAATASSRPTPSGMPMCPTGVEGTQVTAADTPSGETVTFSTAPERAAELRARVHAMADMHNRHHAGGATDPHAGMHHPDGDAGAQAGMHGPEGGGMHHGAMMPPPSTATVEDTDTGARIVVTPKDPADLAKLQAAVREHAQHMQEGCGHMGGGHMGAPPR